MIGNDIIDIKETRRSTNWERRGFLKKIFTENEQAIIGTSDHPFTTVWRLWSMKESAYKVFVQAGGSRFFDPTRIKCSLETEENGSVDIDLISVKTQTTINSNYIFTTASFSEWDILTGVFKYEQQNCSQQSNFIYQQVLSYCAAEHDLNCEELEIKKSMSGVPILWHKKKMLKTSVSITHHGKYGAYSILEDSE